MCWCRVHGDDGRLLCIISPPPLEEIRPRIMILITMVLGQVLDVEDVAYVVLVAWDVNLVGIVVVAC
jgi:hypothetical protein